MQVRFCRVQAVTFSHEGLRIATARDDKTIRVSSLASGKELQLLCVHRGVVWSVSFSPDGNRLVGARWSASDWLKTWKVRGER